MKTVIPALLLTLLVLIGCDNDIEINAPLISPTAVNDTASVDDGESVEIIVIDNDSAAENRTLNSTSVIIITEPEEGSATVDDNGTITYTSDGVFTGTETFTYTVEDTKGAVSNTATVTITITSTQEEELTEEEEEEEKDTAPTAVDDTATATSAEEITIDVLANDINNGNGLNEVTLVEDASDGIVVINSNGTVSYTSNGSFTGTDTFTYQVSDSDDALSNVATVTITITDTDGTKN